MKPEAKVKKKIREFLDPLGAKVVAPIGTVYGKAGVSDLLVCLKGHFVAIEVKAPGRLDGATPLQEKFIRDVVAAGGIGMVADDVEVVRVVLLAHGLVNEEELARCARVEEWFSTEEANALHIRNT